MKILIYKQNKIKILSYDKIKQLTTFEQYVAQTMSWQMWYFFATSQNTITYQELYDE